MKSIYLKIWLFLFLMEGIISGALLFFMKFEANRGHTLNYSLMRQVLLILDTMVVLAILFSIIYLVKNTRFTDNLSFKLSNYLIAHPEKLFGIQFFLGLAIFFVFELLLMTYISIPIPFRPVLIWVWMALIHTWLLLHYVFREVNHQRRKLFSHLKNLWKSSLPVQRKVVIIISIIGFLYFIAFIPINSNSSPTSGRPYFGHDDEIVIYPSVIKVLTPGADLNESINNLLIDNNWWYGYPYLPISAAVLIIPRIIYGVSFGEHIQLNLLLLRQFINVLPMLLALAMLVYLVTQFKKLFFSVGMFLFLLFIPGVFRFNSRFWHPDSIILLLVVMTFYFLQRDKLRFKRYFYLAAVTCGLAAVIKLWGFFFFLVIAGYLLAGLFRKYLSFKNTLLAGIGFIAIMGGTILISSPCFLYPATVKALVNDWGKQLTTNASGYKEPDPEGVYEKGLANWLVYFDLYFMRPWFFFFAFLALILGSLIGSQTYLNRLILGWCFITAIYLIEFVAVKSFQYMMPLMLPLMSAGFLLPDLAERISENSRFPKVIVRRILYVILLIVYISQFLVNIEKIIRNPGWITIL